MVCCNFFYLCTYNNYLGRSAKARVVTEQVLGLEPGHFLKVL